MINIHFNSTAAKSAEIEAIKKATSVGKVRPITKSSKEHNNERQQNKYKKRKAQLVFNPLEKLPQIHRGKEPVTNVHVIDYITLLLVIRSKTAAIVKRLRQKRQLQVKQKYTMHHQRNETVTTGAICDTLYFGYVRQSCLNMPLHAEASCSIVRAKTVNMLAQAQKVQSLI